MIDLTYYTSNPDAAECQRLFQLCGTPDAVIAHGAAVSRCALELAQQLSCPVDSSRLAAACLLHDLTRGTPDHVGSAVQVLTQNGYPTIAAWVAVHHDLPADACPEACLLYLADKLVTGVRRTSLEERFLTSHKKCCTPEALAAWQRRYDRARQIVRQFQLTIPD